MNEQIIYPAGRSASVPFGAGTTLTTYYTPACPEPSCAAPAFPPANRPTRILTRTQNSNSSSSRIWCRRGPAQRRPAAPRRLGEQLRWRSHPRRYYLRWQPVVWTLRSCHFAMHASCTSTKLAQRKPPIASPNQISPLSSSRRSASAWSKNFAAAQHVAAPLTKSLMLCSGLGPHDYDGPSAIRWM